MKEYLCWFIHEHIDFIIPEYQTLCEIEGVPFDCDLHDFQKGVCISKRCHKFHQIKQLFN